jgi:hypothetical protein
MKMSSAVDGYSGKIQIGVGGTGAAPVLAQTSEAKQIKTRPSAHNSGRERRAKGNLFFYVYIVVPWTSTGNSPESTIGNRSQLETPPHPLSSRPGFPATQRWSRLRVRHSLKERRMRSISATKFHRKFGERSRPVPLCPGVPWGVPWRDLQFPPPPAKAGGRPHRTGSVNAPRVPFPAITVPACQSEGAGAIRNICVPKRARAVVLQWLQ